VRVRGPRFHWAKLCRLYGASDFPNTRRAPSAPALGYSVSPLRGFG